MTKNVDTAPDGFYAVCAMGRADGPCYFWAAWWSASGLAVSPAPDAHGIADRVEDAHAKARAAIVAARGQRASVLRLDHTTAASLLSLAYELNQRDTQLVLTSLTTATARSLTRLRLDRSFTLMPDMASALRPADRAEYRRQRFAAVYRPGPPHPLDRVRKPGRVSNRADRAS